MIKRVDYFLDRITMYLLVFYILLFLILIAIIFAFLGFIPFSPFSIIFTFSFITLLSWATNTLFAYVFNAPTNVESTYITAFILTLIVSPVQKFDDIFPVGWVAVLAMSSKYIIALKRKHIFNPAAFAVVASSLGFGLAASWWVGTGVMFPFVLVGGYLIIKKLRFERLFFSFLITNLLLTLAIGLIRGSDAKTLINQIFLNSPLIFFATVMLTEPSTLPPTKALRTLYGVMIGFLTVPQISFGGFYFTPELALLTGNIFSYLVSYKEKLILNLKERIQIAPDIYDFLFVPPVNLAYLPGQYMEWTLEHDNPDSRGNRRYLSLASSPTEDTLRLGIKFYPGGSSFKRALLSIGKNTRLAGAQLAGDFTLPKDKGQKLVFMAGGIGITPFRSIIKYLTDKNEKRNVVLFYSNKTKDDIVYKDIFDKGAEVFGLRTIYVLSDEQAVPAYWNGEVGRINSDMIKRFVPDFYQYLFYLSGPQPMVQAYEKVLKDMGLKNNQIKKDYFPGYA